MLYHGLIQIDRSTVPRLAGMEITIRKTLPETAIIKRRWTERLFSWPWRPFTTTKQIAQPGNIEENKKIYMFSDKIAVTQSIFDQLKKEINNG
ncbi:MAG: hypothetical protein ABJN40_13275 [Sneathiella sp.]